MKHMRDVKNSKKDGKFRTTLAEHCIKNNHSFNFIDVNVVQLGCTNFKKRKIIEPY